MSTILLADDNPHARRMGSEILGDEGHEVVAVENGDEAVAYLKSHRPDMVLADTEMPGASGYELCGFVRSEPKLEGVKFVLLHPPLERFDEERAREAGSDGVLHKPLDATVMIETVSTLLSINGTSTAQEAASEPEPAVDEEAETDEVLADSEPVDESPEPEPTPADPFAAAVAEALSGKQVEAGLRDEVKSAVAEVMEAATPALIDRITERVLESIRKNHQE